MWSTKFLRVHCELRVLDADDRRDKSRRFINPIHKATINNYEQRQSMLFTPAKFNEIMNAAPNRPINYLYIPRCCT